MLQKLSVKVIPKAKKSAIVGWLGEELVVRLAAVPEKGKANDLLLHLLAEALEIAPSQLKIVSGEKGRHKKIVVMNSELNETEIKKRLSCAQSG